MMLWRRLAILCTALACASESTEEENRAEDGDRRASDPIAISDHDVLAVGGTHACAITDEGVICWGNDRFGQLGDGVALGRERSAFVVTDVELRSLAAGWAHTCGLDADGVAYCWGANARGELGDGTLVDRATPVAVLGDRRFAALAAGPGLSCGLTADGKAYCWGTGRTRPHVITNGAPLRAFASASCALSMADTLLCWSVLWSARSSWGETYGTPRAAPATETFRVARGGYGMPYESGDWPLADPNRDRLERAKVCGLTPDGRALCWQAEPDRSDSLPPEPVRVPSPLRTLVVGAQHACGLVADGTGYCWGANEAGQLGDGSRLDRSDAVPVRAPSRFRALAAYGNRTCGITEADALFCWGDTRTTPTRVDVSRDERIRALTADLPSSVPMHTSEEWGFSLPQEHDVRFSGPAACDPGAEDVSLGSETGPVVDMGFERTQSSLDAVVDRTRGVPEDGVLGGFGWRVVVGEVEVRIPIVDDDGNPIGQSAIDYAPIVRGRVFRDPSECALTIAWDGSTSGTVPEALVDAFHAMRLHTEVDSSSIEAHERGLVSYRAGRYAEALVEFKRAVALDNRHAEAVNDAGFTLYRLGRLEESVTWYRRAIELDPGRAVAYMNLGDSLEELGYHGEAITAYQRYLELEPEGGAAGRVRNAIGRLQ